MTGSLTVVSVQHYPEFGGPHNEIVKLDPYLRERGVRTVVVLTDQPGSARARLAGIADLEVVPLERFRTSFDPRLNGRALLRFRRDIAALRSVIRAYGADVVKVHGPHNPHGAIAARLEGVPVVWVLSSTRPSALVRRVGMMYVRRLADALLVNGRSLARFYPGADALAARSFYFYPPLDCERFAPPSPEERAAIRRELALDHDAEVVATIANMTPQKGIEFFVSAAALIAARRPAARFLVVGGEHAAHRVYAERLHQMAASHGLTPDRLQFIGERSDVDRILKGIDVKVIASRAEGTTATAGEAMACGVPVVATDVGAVGDVVEDGVTGLLVPPQDPAAIAEAVIRLLADPETRRQMGDAGRCRALERFGLDACAAVHLDAYRCAVERKARRRMSSVPIETAMEWEPMQEYQELAHPEGHGYRARSPHLKHRRLYDTLLEQLRGVLSDVAARGLPTTLLEVGAGDGAFVEPALAYGCRVTATEMSRHAVAELNERYGANPNFSAVFDADGSLASLGDQRYSIILYASVLHHIPDYLGAVESAITSHLAPGGVFVSFQDPLWYSSLTRGTRLLNDTAYLSWRLTQGNYRRGIASRLRRIRGDYDEQNPSDMVEYHVVRSGVDHDQLVKTLAGRFERVAVMPYWSTPSGFWQGIGERAGTKATFALIARGYSGA